MDATINALSLINSVNVLLYAIYLVVLFWIGKGIGKAFTWLVTKIAQIVVDAVHLKLEQKFYESVSEGLKTAIKEAMNDKESEVYRLFERIYKDIHAVKGAQVQIAEKIIND